MSKSLMLAVFLAGAPAAAHAQDASGSSAGAGAGGGTGQTEAPLGTTAGSDRGVTTTNQSTVSHRPKMLMPLSMVTLVMLSTLSTLNEE